MAQQKDSFEMEEVGGKLLRTVPNSELGKTVPPNVFKMKGGEWMYARKKSS